MCCAPARNGRRRRPLLCDGAKGAAAVLIAAAFLPPGAEIFAALGAVLGHLFPVWLRFKGGKGVATFLGVCLALYWPVGLLVAATWLGAALIWRISSLSALIAIALSPVYFLLLRPATAMRALALLLAVLIFFMHRENIRRLLRGEEPRIGAKEPAMRTLRRQRAPRLAAAGAHRECRPRHLRAI